MYRRIEYINGLLYTKENYYNKLYDWVKAVEQKMRTFLIKNLFFPRKYLKFKNLLYTFKYSLVWGESTRVMLLHF